MTELLYRVGQSEEKKPNKRRRRILWAIAALIILLLSFWAFIWIREKLKPKVTIKQSTAVTTKVSYDQKTKHYDEPDFGIDILATWHPLPRPAGSYQTFSWQSSDVGSNGQIIQIFEDTIPVNYAVNRVLIVEGQTDQAQINGEVSDNCVKFTREVGATNKIGVPAKWQGISFICDQANYQRDVIGTSSSEGTNFVTLKSPVDGLTHKFFFTFDNHGTNPDYTIFYNAIQSLRMK